MSARLLLAALGLTALVQVAVPLHMVAARERVLREGTLFKFRTAPVDPYDAFRGRYVALDMRDDWVDMTNAMELRSGDYTYVSVGTAADGFARLVAAHTRPPSNRACVRARVRRTVRDRAMIDTPFDRFYMREDLAPQAEDAYQRHARVSNTYVTVRVLDGQAVLEELYLDGVPIHEYLATRLAERDE